MPLLTAGRNLIAALLINSGSPTDYRAANAYLGVGDDTTAFSAAHTDLQAASNKDRNAQESTYPQLATNVMTFRSLWGTSEANFAWEEHGLFNASSSGTMLYRKVESLGTKTNAASWQLTVDVTVSIGS